MQFDTPNLDSLRTLANYYRRLAGDFYAAGQDTKAEEHRTAAARLESLAKELPKLPEPKVVTR
jgi:hypothetical protein